MTQTRADSMTIGFPIGGRKLLMALLVLVFALQTLLVYGDETGREQPPLSPAALAGRTIWLDHNCQTCHQLYGFGGFLGPDLTNATSRLSRDRLDEVLTAGNLQMPAFDLSPTEIDAVEAYLAAMDRTGVGQARASRPDLAAFTAAVQELAGIMEVDDIVSSGAGLFFGGTCTGCHSALTPRRIGRYLAPDLSMTPATLSDNQILTVLTNGRPELGMPPTGLDGHQRQTIVAFLRWLGDNRESLAARVAGDATRLPWFEFR